MSISNAISRSKQDHLSSQLQKAKFSLNFLTWQLWRVLNQRDWAAATSLQMRGRTLSPVLSFQKAWMHYPTVTLHWRRKSPWTPRLLPTYSMWRVERSADQSQSKKRENVKKKKKKVYREERMQADTVGNGPFGYTASKTCNEDARKESFWAFLFSKITAENKGNPVWCTICISRINTMCNQFSSIWSQSESCDWERKRQVNKVVT